MVSLFHVTVSLLCSAVAGLHALDYLPAILPRNLAGDACTLLVLPTAYFAGVVLLYLQIVPAQPALVSPSALRLFAAMACSQLLLVAVMTLAPWLFSL